MLDPSNSPRMTSIGVGAGWEPIWAPVLAFATSLGVVLEKVDAILGEMRFTLAPGQSIPHILKQVMERATEASKSTCPVCGEPSKFRANLKTGRVYHEPLCSLHWEERREFDEKLALGVADAVDAEVVRIIPPSHWRGIAGPV